MMRSLTAPIWNDFTNISSGHGRESGPLPPPTQGSPWTLIVKNDIEK
jgi:hypothetical protein